MLGQDAREVEFELTGLEEHVRDSGYTTESEWHAAWHRLNGVPIGQPGCPQDACDDDGSPRWRGTHLESPNYCDGRVPEPPF